MTHQMNTHGYWAWSNLK